MEYYTSELFFSIHFRGKYYIYEILSGEREAGEDAPDAAEG